MKKKLIIVLALIQIFCFAVVWADPNVAAPAAILIDGKTGRVLHEKNADQQMYPASTTKIMTCILAIEKGSLNDIVTIGKNPAALIERGSSQIYLIPGEQLTLEQLIYALMLSSANDAAIAIAEHISGSVESFSDLMNLKAKEVGTNNTNFVNPNGLHNDNHYTTARDLAKIAYYCMKNEIFRKIVSTYSYEIPANEKQEARPYIRNSNKLIWNSSSNSNYYESATGIKTGYTFKAKHCLTGGASSNDLDLITVVLGTEKPYLYTDTKALFEYGFENFAYTKLLEKNQIVTTIPIQNTDIKINLISEEDFSLTLNKAENDELQKNIILDETIPEEFEPGQILGKIVYSIGGEEIKTINLSAEEGYTPPKISTKIKNMIGDKKFSWKWLLWVFLLFIIYRAIVTYIKVKKRNSRKTNFVRR